MNGTESAKAKCNLLTVRYKAHYDKWNTESDDRKLFCNIYEQLSEALNAMSEVENLFVWSAFAKHFTAATKLMDEIAIRFCCKGKRFDGKCDHGCCNCHR